MKRLFLIIVGLLALLAVWSGVSIYPEWLWFKNLGFSPIFWTMLASKVGFGLIVWLLLILIVTVNIAVAQRASRESGSGQRLGGQLGQYGLSGNALSILLIALILIVSLVIASKGSAQWDMILRYIFQEPFGKADPVFEKDIGFYVFSLPVFLFVRNGLLILFVFAGIASLLWYIKEGGLQVVGELSQSDGLPTSLPKFVIIEKAKKHLVFLAGIIVILIAWGYYLKIYGLLFSTQGPAFGASYTDIHTRTWAYGALIAATLTFAAVLFWSLHTFRIRRIWISGGVWLVLVFLLTGALPLTVQKIVVKPNELEKESPYIAYNIDHTRNAYNLDKVKEVDFKVSKSLNERDLKENAETIQNIRIWDERPLLQTYRQIQAIRLYYDFNNVDVDRYVIDGQYRQVMLAAREMMSDQLPPQANTWVNRHLTYTHGYGGALNPVNEVTAEGLPRLFVKDLPPATKPGLEIDRPELYYGEKTVQYILVNTANKEFDYPRGDKNVYTTYQGRGGVEIGSFLRRLLFAVEFLDPQILFTGYLKEDSRIMFHRQIRARAKTIAPFLDYDRDPYLVISGGKLFWILDAYTTSNMYPYSIRNPRSFGNKSLNYIRNSVKVVIDAYNGELSFYLMDKNDPIVKTYSEIFPDLFRPFEEMPDDLKRHIRYPRDLFEMQAKTYRAYHMEDPQVFYNQEDLWEIPDELYADKRQKIEPYYIIMKLPGKEKVEFLLMLPFTPSKKDNMIGWLAARCDIPNYGNLVVFKLPKEKLVYGPMQIEARIDQQTEISRQLSLWGQRGSRVIRGNLLAIPLGDTFIYVEPVYLQAKQEESPETGSRGPGGSRFRRPTRGQAPGVAVKSISEAAALPELKRVIVAFSNRLAMEKDLDTALKRVLGREVSPEKPVSKQVKGAPVGRELGAKALEHYEKAKTHLRQGNWSGFGEELRKLEEVLERISREEREKQNSSGGGEGENGEGGRM